MKIFQTVKTLFTLLFLILFSLGNLRAQEFEKQIHDLIANQVNKPEGPGGVFMVAKDGELKFLKAVGMANLELKVPMSPDQVFQIGSMTKQFTAVGILLLHQEGLLDVKDPISNYASDFPNGDQITIHHLLSHTSGIRDFTKMKSLNAIATKKMTPKEMVDFFKNEPVDFSPGEKFEYNNSNYVLLGYLIELVSGNPYAEFLQTRIFDPIGMTNSYFATDRLLIPNRADGYHLKETGYVNRTVIDFSVPFSSGSLMSTVFDLLKWQMALNGDRLLNEASKVMVFSPKKLSNGEEISYGYGWHIRQIQGNPSREHGGSIFGFKSMAVYIPTRDIYVVGLTNCDCISPTQLVLDIAKVSLEMLPE